MDELVASVEATQDSEKGTTKPKKIFLDSSLQSLKEEPISNNSAFAINSVKYFTNEVHLKFKGPVNDSVGKKFGLVVVDKEGEVLLSAKLEFPKLE